MSAQGSLVSEGFDKFLEFLASPPQRYPVLNTEPREPIPAQKRAIIHERDGGRCTYCDQVIALTVDHIRPRSNYPVSELHLADRSDNLISACWPCNERKSNFHWVGRRVIGVVPKCWYCANRLPLDVTDWELEDRGLEHPELTTPAYCGRHGGTMHVPDVGWVL